MMKRLDVLYGPNAPLDIEHLEEWLILNGAGLSTIDRYISRLRDRCEKIGDLPYGGRDRHDLATDLRTVIFENRILIAYKVHPDHVEIINLFSHGRDYEAFYGEAFYGDDGEGG